MPAETEAYELAYVVEQTKVPSERWLRELLAAGKVPGRKAGRKWLMTASDIAALIEFIKVPRRVGSQSIAEGQESASYGSTGLTQRSRRKPRPRLTPPTSRV